MVDIGNFTSASFENFDIDLVQNEVGGGTVSIEQIDEKIMGPVLEYLRRCNHKEQVLRKM